MTQPNKCYCRASGGFPIFPGPCERLTVRAGATVRKPVAVPVTAPVVAPIAPSIARDSSSLFQYAALGRGSRNL